VRGKAAAGATAIMEASASCVKCFLYCNKQIGQIWKFIRSFLRFFEVFGRELAPASGPAAVFCGAATLYPEPLRGAGCPVLDAYKP
jgi:hypothetical protein